ERIALLSDVLPTIPSGKRMFVEIKCGPEVLPAMKRTFIEVGVPSDRLAIITFGYETAAAAKRTFPEIPVYWLSSLKQDEQTGEFGPPRDELIAKAKAIGVDGLDLQARPVIDAEYVRAVKEAGLGFYVWTVNDPAEAKRLIEAGVDGITTDRPAYLREELGLSD
ncbi:MAG TPA: glycerophosphodiester phosphodiesterase family protein, partial [Planctomycetaceae bacterium]